ncbi:MAG: PilZ domain-containing protein [Acidobacteriia bacterium]|nr:PilZ domain-containing protein [Terriglobia bacterium]
MYPVGSSQIASRPDERRSYARHRTISLMYVQLGPENGGIVVNLGRNGVAFQAARELNVEKNSFLGLRLRGSGLNAELAGEIVWLSATGKEAGICFQNVSAGVQQEIADWIEREVRVCQTSAPGDGLRTKAMSAMPGITATREKPAAHSLSGAMAMSRAMSADPVARAGLDAGSSSFPAALDFGAVQPGPAPLPEIVPPNESGDTFSVGLGGSPQHRDAETVMPPEQNQVGQALHDQPLQEKSPIELPQQFPVEASCRMDVSEAAASAMPQKLPRESAESPVQSGILKPEEVSSAEVAPKSGGHVSGSPGDVLGATAAERWIPPALLAAWRLGNRRRKMLLAGAAGVCIVIFVLILGLAVAGVDGRVGRPARNASLKQPAAPAVSIPQSKAPVAASGGSVDPPQIAMAQTGAAAPATPRPKSPQPPTSLLASLKEYIMGSDPDAKNEIDDDQIGVQVWASKRSGYYYCADSPFYKRLQPGSFMTQGDALQSGYQPRRDHFCD